MEFTDAVRSSFIEPVQMMIERVSPDTICKFITKNKNLLSDGIFRGGQSTACINLLLERGALKFLNQPGNDGYTSLLKSLIFQEDANLAMILLEKGAVPYITVPFRTVTALHVAAGFLFGPIRRYENVVREPAGFTSLDVVKKILDSEYKDTLLDAVDRRGETPLMYAIQANKSETVKVLLQHKASPNIANSDGLTPLKLTIDMANPTLVKLLLEHEANVNYVNRQRGSTPLQYALTCYYDYSEVNATIAITKLLLAHGACTRVKDAKGNSVLHLTLNHFESGSRVVLLEPLIQHGAEVDWPIRLG
jgi:ankyrin repeat protein